jgi:hypothetical protein
LKQFNIDNKQIDLLKKYYIDYNINKQNKHSLNNYFVKFIDLIQAQSFIKNNTKNINEIDKQDTISINDNNLNKINSVFIDK